MQFLHPQFWWLSALGLIPLALYLFKRRSKPIAVSTMVFFRWLAQEHQDSAWLRRFKHWLSFALTMLMLLAPVFALTRLAMSPFSDDTRQVVILLDRSASMAARDSQGRTRFEDAVRLIRERVSALGGEVRVALVAYDSRAEVVEARSLQRRSLLAALERLEVRPVAGNPGAALETVFTLAGLETPAEVWHVSDRPVVPEALPAGVRFIAVPVALEEPFNVGFTAFQIRREPLQASRHAAFVQIVANAGAPEAVSGRIEGRIGEIPFPPRSFTVQPGEVKGFEIPLDGNPGQLLRLDLKVPGDQLDLDDTLLAPLPEGRPVVAVRVGPKDAVDPFAHLALQSLVEEGELEVWSAQPEQWPVEGADVVVFDNWLPAEWPTGIPVVVLNPPGSLGPVRARRLGSVGLPQREIREMVPDHPVLFRVNTARMSVTQSCVLEVVRPLESLWMGGTEPLLLAGTVGGQRVVVMGFSPRLSERLPMTASFPLLMGNALYWAAEGRRDRQEAGTSSGRTGDFVEISGRTLRWTRAQGSALVREIEALDGAVVELGRNGVWEDEAGRRGTAHLLSRLESDLPGLEETAAGEEFRRSGPLTAFGSLTGLILGLLLGLLLLESWLFHRFAVY